MKAFIAGTATALVIAVISAYVLGAVNKPVDTAFTTSSARVSHN
jgi:hypothetical protein